MNNIIYFFLTFFISLHSVHTNELTDLQQQICQSIKKLQPGTGFDKYLAKTQEMEQNSLSTCSCVNFLLEQRKQKIHAMLEKELGVTKEFWQEHDKKLKKLRKEDEEQAEITFDVSVSEKQKEKIREIIETHEFKAPIKISTNKKQIYNCDRMIDQTHNFTTPFLLNIDEKFDEGDICHELQHAKEYHPVTCKILQSYLKSKNLPTKLTQNAFKFNRFLESEADQKAALFGSYKNADYIMSLNTKLYFEYTFESWSKKSTHPSINKRFEWSVRIAKLKQAEEVLAHRKQKHISEPDYRIADF